jgi:protein-S-isoprenylcysteine O-methyltransferase Ste14
MKASGFEFRFRFLIHLVIFVVGFAAPWNYAVHWDQGSSWLFAAVYLARTGAFTLGSATIALLVLGIVCAMSAAWLRTWGAAYIGSSVVGSSAMHGAGVVADGPYRYLRNPLYVGIFLHTLALALLMPATGAVFAIVLIAVFEVRLALAEEPFLRAKLGESYAAYCELVPRFIPALRARVQGTGAKAAWGQAVLGEVYFWGVAGSFAVAGWRYNAQLLMQCCLVSLGASLVARAFVKPVAD